MHQRNFQTVLTATAALGLDVTERAIMLLLAACGDDQGECTPANVKPKTVRRACRAVSSATGLSQGSVRVIWAGLVSYEGAAS